MTQFHPLADAFPLLEGREFMDLSDDIAANGLNHPVVIFEGKILDGRNRYRACLSARVEPFRREFAGDFAAARRFVISENLRRRHLDESQRAIAGAKLSNIKPGDNQHTIGSANLQSLAISQSDAADMLGVSTRSIASAAKVLKEGADELVAAMESGVASVSAAAEIATLSQDEQREIVAAGPAALVETAKAIRGGGFLQMEPSRVIPNGTRRPNMSSLHARSWASLMLTRRRTSLRKRPSRPRRSTPASRTAWRIPGPAACGSIRRTLSRTFASLSTSSLTSTSRAGGPKPSC